MRMFLKGAALALALAGAAVVTAGTANADNYDHGRNNGTITIGFGGIAFGYRDGYWDNGHHWHRWSHRHDYRNYRDQNGSNYHDWNHDRDGNDGWQNR